TAGHIDHGKTSLVRALTGVDTDRLKEEKARGISIELGFAYLPTPDGSVLGFVDVPGHEKFIHTMLAGATGVDFVLLVVAADDGVMPQTREHVAIVDLLGVRHGIVVSGQVAVGDRVTISPSGREARVRTIHAHNRPAQRGAAGLRCALNLAGDGITKDAIARGDVVLDPELHAPTERIDATLQM